MTSPDLRSFVGAAFAAVFLAGLSACDRKPVEPVVTAPAPSPSTTVPSATVSTPTTDSQAMTPMPGASAASQ